MHFHVLLEIERQLMYCKPSIILLLNYIFVNAYVCLLYLLLCSTNILTKHCVHSVITDSPSSGQNVDSKVTMETYDVNSPELRNLLQGNRLLPQHFNKLVIEPLLHLL